ncbi:MAG TPA: cytochrome P450 [Trebonia sp.]|nr:cytochrome P450 [Trebonia sp.]
MTAALPVPSRLAGMDGLSPLSATTTCADPQAEYRKLLDRWGLVAPVQLEPGVNAWLVMGYDEICHVVRHERLFSRDPHNWRDLSEGRVAPDSGLGPMMFPRDNAYFKDGETHRRLRAPLDDAVSGLHQRRMGRQVKAICADLIAGFAARGRAELVTEYAAVIPMLAVADMFGLDTSLGHELRMCLLALFGSASDSQAGNARFEEILTGIMRDRQATPADDVTSSFVSHPHLHNDYEIMQSMVLMISAGYETTTCWIAQTLRLMLTDPRFAGRVRGGRLGVDDALDEVLWRDPPMANMPARFALRDTELAGQPIQPGDALILGLAAANADPRVHADDAWAELGNRSHLAWSTGPHACPAHLPARIIARAAVETALNLLPEIHLAVPDNEISLIPSPWTRCPASLPVTFTTAAIGPQGRP